MAEAIQIIRTLTQEDFDRFAAISGDDNPIHVDPAFASRARFGTTVAHGMFLYSILEGLAEQIMGDAGIAQTALMFPAPARLGDEIAFAGREENPDLLELTARRTSDGETVCKLTLVLDKRS
ncbi:hydratase [Parvularcula flava]|uniref:Hydratase n=1 Tax=Aquisalinus luteolus TaxID=1566827 RepID=A0A8J3ERX6_9PROT|nr:MaoC/PaaZ C-terminal domain-containing protein [Aquisalinus luteolus]NHK28670.1 hydratase [Aquisalinus luteolus]GGH99169.1 dehydratase [Aquisalinus luteolus]